MSLALLSLFSNSLLVPKMFLSAINLRFKKKNCKIFIIFTELAQWDDSVAMSVCVSVSLSVCGVG